MNTISPQNNLRRTCIRTHPSACLVKPAQRAGFTLIELLAVITLIAILMGMLFGAAQLVIRVANNQRRDATAKALEVALANYRHEYGQWPVAPSLVGSITNGILQFTNGPQNYLVFDLLRSSSNDTRNPYNTNNIPFIDISTVLSPVNGICTPRHRLPPDSLYNGLIETNYPIVYKRSNGSAGYYTLTIDFERENVTVSP